MSKLIGIRSSGIDTHFIKSEHHFARIRIESINDIIRTLYSSQRWAFTHFDSGLVMEKNRSVSQKSQLFCCFGRLLCFVFTLISRAYLELSNEFTSFGLEI